MLFRIALDLFAHRLRLPIRMAVTVRRAPRSDVTADETTGHYWRGEIQPGLLVPRTGRRRVITAFGSTARTTRKILIAGRDAVDPHAATVKTRAAKVNIVRMALAPLIREIEIEGPNRMPVTARPLPVEGPAVARRIMEAEFRAVHDTDRPLLRAVK